MQHCFFHDNNHISEKVILRYWLTLSENNCYAYKNSE